MRCLRMAARTTTPLVAKQRTAPSAVTRVSDGFRRRTSAKTAASAKIIPRTFSHNGARPEAELHKNGCETDRGHDHQSHWAEECTPARVNHDYAQRSNQNSSSEYSPPARLQARIGRGVGHKFRPGSYTAPSLRFQISGALLEEVLDQFSTGLDCRYPNNCTSGMDGLSRSFFITIERLLGR